MDKLEKAMEKARKDRETNTGGTYITGKPSFPSTQTYQNLATATPLTIEDALFEQNRILAHHARNPEADIFRILRTRVLQIMNKSDFRTLAITSPRYGDGKSTIALNLALSIALDLKQTVLLVDLDLRKPTLQNFLGLQEPSGIADYLIDNVPIANCLSRLPFERLSILPGGKSLDNSSEILGSPKMATLAQELKMRYRDRLIIYDMPPVLAQDDSIAFLPHVEATLVVVRDGVTSEDDLKTSLERLASANVIGTVLNNAAHS